MAAPKRRLNPDLPLAIKASGQKLGVLAEAAGFLRAPQMYETLRTDIIRASPKTIKRLENLAAIIGFTDSIFVDGGR